MGRDRWSLVGVVAAMALAWSGCGGSDGESSPDATTEDGATDTDGDGAGTVCGNEVCSTSQQCCITQEGGTQTAACIPATEECEGVTIGCTGPEDCPGQECCLHQGSATCVPTGSCQGTDVECGTTADCSDETVCCSDFGGGAAPTISCLSLGECEGLVQCGADDECIDSGAGDCCRFGACTEICGAGPAE